MSTGAVGTIPASRLRMQVGAHGAWWCDADLTEEETLSGRVTIQLADITAQGTIVSGGAIHGTASYRIVGGAGGWAKALPRKGYSDDAGIRVSKLISDAAAECGESVSSLPTDRLGPHFSRVAGMGSRLLNLLAPESWYVGLDGVTTFGARPVTEYKGDGARTRVDKGARVIEIATEEIAALVPGVTVDGSGPASDVEYLLDENRLTVRVYSSGTVVSRRLRALKRIIELLYPDIKYRGSYEFRVVRQTGERLDLQPVRVATGLSDLANVPIRPGVSGFRSNVTLGELVVVTFLDADGSRPVVVGHDSADAPGWLPSLTEIGKTTDFLATKAALDAVQSKLDALVTKYNSHVHPTGVGPSGTTTPSADPAGAQPHTDILKASHT
jgi:hypothetical protein